MGAKGERLLQETMSSLGPLRSCANLCRRSRSRKGGGGGGGGGGRLGGAAGTQGCLRFKEEDEGRERERVRERLEEEEFQEKAKGGSM